MKQTITSLLLLLTVTLMAQMTATFESLSLPLDSFDRAAFDVGERTIDGVRLPNTYDPGFNSWTGTVVSTGTDVTTAGFTNQYSAITGMGADGSNHYVMVYVSGQAGLALDVNQPSTIDALKITNSTFATLSMRDGDAFAKRFGGITGDDPDFFYVTIAGYNDGAETGTSVDVYLADFRFSDNSQDYILDTWERVDLTSLGPVDSLSFRMSSSDVGQFGINTPTYFAIDDIEISPVTSTSDDNPSSALRTYPNPAHDMIYVSGLPAGDPYQIHVYDMQGRQVLQQPTDDDVVARIPIAQLMSGHYVLSIRSEDRVLGMERIVVL